MHEPLVGNRLRAPRWPTLLPASWCLSRPRPACSAGFPTLMITLAGQQDRVTLRFDLSPDSIHSMAREVGIVRPLNSEPAS
jgi:hypothetical protein